MPWPHRPTSGALRSFAPLERLAWDERELHIFDCTEFPASSGAGAILPIKSATSSSRYGGGADRRASGKRTTCALSGWSTRAVSRKSRSLTATGGNNFSDAFDAQRVSRITFSS